MTPLLVAALSCGLHADFVKTLADKYHEFPAAEGLSTTGAMVQLLTSPDGSTWTLLQVTPDGHACIVNAGRDWQEHAKPLEDAPT
jgi:hypothetical protein